VIIPTEPIGSIPRLLRLIEAFSVTDSADPMLNPLYEEAIRDTIARFEATGSPVITDGEQRKYHNFGTYCVDGLPNLAPDGFKLPFVSHTRRWPRLTSGPSSAFCAIQEGLPWSSWLSRFSTSRAPISVLA
jgi:5-methyltetrahydropteroyltriglutamate--homocysteine methyltransferase